MENFKGQKLSKLCIKSAFCVNYMQTTNQTPQKKRLQINVIA
jgi:hypothetical protein